MNAPPAYQTRSNSPGRWGEAVSKLQNNVAAGDFGEAGRAGGLC
jgi:hypothetical protein